MLGVSETGYFEVGMTISTILPARRAANQLEPPRVDP
jgi:hypothetical protein